MSKENSNKEISNKEGKNPPRGGSKVIKNNIAVDINKFSNLEGKFLLVRVGTVEKPANNENIKDIEDKLIKLFKDNNVNCLAFVTHHAVDVSLF